MSNPAIGTQIQQTPQEYVRSLMKMRGITVQKMCDDTGLIKSTLDKWFAGQTADTSFSNVMIMVKYLGGSLDYLAQIVAASHPPQPKANYGGAVRVEYPALDRLVESYEKEIARNEANHHRELERLTQSNSKYIDHILALFETGRQALIKQHTSAIEHERALCESSISDMDKHLQSLRGGRNAWRGIALGACSVLLVVIVWLVWEFSNLSSGLTGQLLRNAGMI